MGDVMPQRVWVDAVADVAVDGDLIVLRIGDVFSVRLSPMQARRLANLLLDAAQAVRLREIDDAG